MSAVRRPATEFVAQALVKIFTTRFATATYKYDPLFDQATVRCAVQNRKFTITIEEDDE